MSDETRRRLIIGGPLAFVSLVLFLLIRAARQSEFVAPAQSAQTVGATAQPAKQEPTPFELAEPSLGKVNLSPDGLTLIKANRILGSEGRKLDFPPYPCIHGDYSTFALAEGTLCVGNTISYAWYGDSVVATFFESTFKPASSEVYALAVRMPGPDVYDTADAVPKTYKNLCILGACLGLNKEDERPQGFWKACANEGPCPSKWRGMEERHHIKNQTHVVRGHLVYYGGFTRWIMVFNYRDYISLPR